MWHNGGHSMVMENVTEQSTIQLKCGAEWFFSIIIFNNGFYFSRENALNNFLNFQKLLDILIHILDSFFNNQALLGFFILRIFYVCKIFSKDNFDLSIITIFRLWVPIPSRKISKYFINRLCCVVSFLHFYM